MSVQKTIIFLIYSFCSITFCSAQAKLKILNSEDQEYQFPYILLSNKINQDKINNYLHLSFLETVPNSSKNPFHKTLNKETFYQNSAYFNDVSILKNNLPLTTISFFVEYCGAYCEGRFINLSFDTDNGNLITPKELIADKKWYDLAEKLNNNVEKQISNFLLEIPDPRTESDEETKRMFEEQLYLYGNCLEEVNQYKTDSYEMYFKNDSVIFNRNRCSAHVNRAIDDLGNFEIKFSKKEIAPYLSDYGKQLLNNQPRKMTTLSNKTFEGKIDKYPIKGIIYDIYKNSDSNDYSFTGIYWYERIKTPIQVNGRIVNNKYIIDEFENDDYYQPSASFILKRDNNKLIGTWEQPNKNKNLITELNFGL